MRVGGRSESLGRIEWKGRRKGRGWGDRVGGWSRGGYGQKGGGGCGRVAVGRYALGLSWGSPPSKHFWQFQARLAPERAASESTLILRALQPTKIHDVSIFVASGTSREREFRLLLT